jgi:hypothetical protein
MEKTTKKVAPNEAFLRSIIFPEEDRHLYTSLPWCGGYRWFKSKNVVCIEHYRRLESLPQRKAL